MQNYENYRYTYIFMRHKYMQMHRMLFPYALHEHDHRWEIDFKLIVPTTLTFDASKRIK